MCGSVESESIKQWPLSYYTSTSQVRSQRRGGDFNTFLLHWSKFNILTLLTRTGNTVNIQFVVYKLRFLLHFSCWIQSVLWMCLIWILIYEMISLMKYLHTRFFTRILEIWLFLNYCYFSKCLTLCILLNCYHTGWFGWFNTPVTPVISEHVDLLVCIIYKIWLWLNVFSYSLTGWSLIETLLLWNVCDMK